MVRLRRLVLVVSAEPDGHAAQGQIRSNVTFRERRIQEDVEGRVHPGNARSCGRLLPLANRFCTLPHKIEKGPLREIRKWP